MLFKTAWRNALRNLRRSFVTAIAVAVGAGGLAMFQAFNTGIMVSNRDNTVHAKYGNGQVTTAGYRDHIYERPWQHWISHPDQTAKVIRRLPGVLDVFPRIEFFSLLSNGHTSIGGKGIGVDGRREAKFFHGVKIIAGEHLGDDADGIILGSGLARALAVKPGDQVTVLGNTIRGSISGLDLVVKGISEVGLRELDDSMFQIQLSRAQELLDTQSVEYFAVGMQSYDGWDRVASEITMKFPKLETKSFAVLDRIWYQHTVDWLASQFQVIRLIILTIVLLGIFNSASTAILERARELGMLRANGESILNIMTMLAWEGAFVGIFGAMFGIVVVTVLKFTCFHAGILMPPPPGYTNVGRIPLELSPHIIASSFTVAVMTALMATLLAGQKIARMPIAQALKAL